MKRAPMYRKTVGLMVLFASALASAQSAPGVITPEGTISLPAGAPPLGTQSFPLKPIQGLSANPRPLLSSLSKAELEALLKNKPLSIDDAVGIALSTNRSFISAVEALQKAKGRTREVEANLRPLISQSAEITEFDQDNAAIFPGAAAGTPPFIIVNQFNPVYTTALTLPIDIFGTIKAASSQARFNELAARIDVNRSRNQLVYDVRNAFYQALRANGQYLVAQAALTANLARLDDAKKAFSVGTVSRFDVITVQRDVADSQQSVLNAKAQTSLALAQLKNVIGIDISAPIKISNETGVENPPGVTTYQLPPPDAVDPLDKNFPDVAIDPKLLLPREIEPSNSGDRVMSKLTIVGDEIVYGPEYDAALKEALEARPEVLESDAQIAAAERGMQYARRSSLPSVGITLAYTYQPKAAGFTKVNTGTATFGVTIPLSDGGTAAARREQSHADIDLARTARRAAVDQVTYDVQSAYVNLLQGRQRVQVANVGVVQAQEAFRLARVRYLAGIAQQQTVSPQIEISNAQTNLTQAQTNRLNALYDYNLARTQLDRAMGRYSYGVGPGFNKKPRPVAHL